MIFFALFWAHLSLSFAANVHVFAAASLTDALKEIAVGYQSKSGDKLVFNFGASSVLARQIQEGAPADFFFSADEEKMNLLEKRGLLEEGTRQSILSNSLVIVLATDSKLAIQSPDDLRKARRVALAETTTVPAGIYARKFLEERNLWNALKSSVIPTENVRGALAAVESGNVDAGIAYKTDAAISKKVKIAFEVPTRDTPGISYPAAVIKDSRNARSAGQFLNFLQTEPALKIFESFGFLARSR